MDTLTVVDLLTEYPELAVGLAILLRAARAYQSELTWREYRALHRLKRGVLPLIAPLVGARVPLVTDKGGRDDPEYRVTLSGGIRSVVSDLRGAGGSLHLINSLKRRPDTHGDPLTDAHLIWTVENEQVECYLFDNSDGTVDLYTQTETSVDDPLGHLTDGVDAGDKHDVVPELSQ